MRRTGTPATCVTPGGRTMTRCPKTPIRSPNRAGLKLPPAALPASGAWAKASDGTCGWVSARGAASGCAGSAGRDGAVVDGAAVDGGAAGAGDAGGQQPGPEGT